MLPNPRRRSSWVSRSVWTQSSNQTKRKKWIHYFWSPKNSRRESWAASAARPASQTAIGSWTSDLFFYFLTSIPPITVNSNPRPLAFGRTNKPAHTNPNAAAVRSRDESRAVEVVSRMVEVGFWPGTYQKQVKSQLRGESSRWMGLDCKLYNFW